MGPLGRLALLLCLLLSAVGACTNGVWRIFEDDTIPAAHFYDYNRGESDHLERY